MNLIEMSWPQVNEVDLDTAVAILPVGSIEQHGYHAALGTDTVIAESLASAVSGNPSTLVLPVLAVGISDYHRHFTGTLWVRSGTMKAYITDILDSLRYQGIKRYVFVNGHGGNRATLEEICRYYRMDYCMYGVSFTWFDTISCAISSLFGENRPLHADEVETSMLLFLRPDLVNQNDLELSKRGASEQWRLFYDNIMVSQEVKDFSESGATGDPTKCDIKKGEQLFKASKEKLDNLVKYLVSLTDDQIASR